MAMRGGKVHPVLMPALAALALSGLIVLVSISQPRTQRTALLVPGFQVPEEPMKGAPFMADGLRGGLPAPYSEGNKLGNVQVGFTVAASVCDTFPRAILFCGFPMGLLHCPTNCSTMRLHHPASPNHSQARVAKVHVLRLAEFLFESMIAVHANGFHELVSRSAGGGGSSR